jgi:hypothetical protein
MFCLPAVEKLEYNLAEFTKPDNLARTFHRPPYYQEVIGSPKCKKIAVSTLPAGCCLRNKPPRRAPALQWCFVVSQFESVGTSIAAVLFLASLASCCADPAPVIIFSGDTALSDSFAELRASGPFDLAIMPIGAYNPWILSPCTPEQAVHMANEAGAHFIMPVHLAVVLRTMRLLANSGLR